MNDIGTIAARVRVTEAGMAFKPADVKLATEDLPAIVAVNHDGREVRLRASIDNSKAAARLLYQDADVAMAVAIGARGRMIGTLTAIAPAGVAP